MPGSLRCFVLQAEVESRLEIELDKIYVRLFLPQLHLDFDKVIGDDRQLDLF